MSQTLVINEIYLSLQGESTFAGLPCIFIRLTACDLRCSYCDTAYAFTEGNKRSLAEVRAEVVRLAEPYFQTCQPTKIRCRELPLVELTGGEPLLQKNAFPLMQALCDDGFTVLLETSGAHDIAAVDSRVRRIMDLKCPSSGEVERNRWDNISLLKTPTKSNLSLAPSKIMPGQSRLFRNISSIRFVLCFFHGCILSRRNNATAHSSKFPPGKFPFRDRN